MGRPRLAGHARQEARMTTRLLLAAAVLTGGAPADPASPPVPGTPVVP
jgi:hypothetical protein